MSDHRVEVIKADAVLIGGGIASATLASLLSILEPTWHLEVCERLDGVGLESSAGWNNAGTGHSALCELNYTPQDIDGSVDPAKAISINEQFQISRQFWAYLVENDLIASPEEFIRPVPHMSFVHGADNIEYLRRRHEALVRSPLFEGMEFTTDHARIEQWAPLITAGRPVTENVAATFAPQGTDVDFGALTRALFNHAATVNTTVSTGAEVISIRRLGRDWGVMVRATDSGAVRILRAPFVFVGAGGAALPLLQHAGIAEIRGFGGFPISGQWLRCTNPDIIQRHHAKVYGKASVGAPPMSVPHLDTRVIDGERALMFGPYAGFSPKFLKTGSMTDLIRSVRPGNILPNLAVARDNLDLVRYLVGELTNSMRDRMDALRTYMPSARAEDWELVIAGQRVQVIAPDKTRKGVLQFGTQLITAGDRSIGGMLGASPGASTSTTIMLNLLKTVFPERIDAWRPGITRLVPSYGTTLSSDAAAARRSLSRTAEALGLISD
ncbi:malate:quinone oxidoreductase [Devriesea agamarum]|uniref:malate:quinone oxidoreductase n=1 Tax=Devriesea agamarum TaxID=472569 RepID=UPI00071DBAF0|nr:malate:quinone oxidoreductase [Devriesea agamarum]